VTTKKKLYLLNSETEKCNFKKNLPYMKTLLEKCTNIFYDSKCNITANIEVRGRPNNSKLSSPTERPYRLLSIGFEFHYVSGSI